MVRAVRRGRVGQTSQHLAVLAAALLGCRGEVVEVEPPEPRPTAVVLVVVDTLRADFTSYAGYPKSTTPVLDRLAAEGVVFEQAYAPSGWTVPSMA